jgi:hypothetical protein
MGRMEALFSTSDTTSQDPKEEVAGESVLLWDGGRRCCSGTAAVGWFGTAVRRPSGRPWSGTAVVGETVGRGRRPSGRQLSGMRPSAWLGRRRGHWPWRGGAAAGMGVGDSPAARQGGGPAPRREPGGGWYEAGKNGG